jgi:purine-nucleoside phosphorylase
VYIYITVGGTKVARVPIHIRAEPGDYAETCLLPGDPLRAKYIAETFSTTPSRGTATRDVRLHG